MREGYTRSRARFSSYYSDSGAGDRGYAQRPRGGGNSLMKYVAGAVIVVVIAALFITFKGPILSVFGVGATPTPTPTPTTEAIVTPEPTLAPTATPEPTETAPAEPTATPSPTPQPVTDITVSAVGNIIMDKSELTDAKDSTTGDYDFTSLFAEIKDQLAGSSLTVGTLESTVAGKDAGFTTGTSKYNTPESILTTLKDLGFKALSTAHTHIFDKGFTGVTATMDNIVAAGMTPVGTYKSKEDYHADPTMLNLSGVNVAILAYAGPGKNESSLTSAQDNFVIKHITLTTIKDDVTAARTKGAQIVIVMMSWGNETDKTPSTAIQDQAKKIIGYGANLIIGSNPNYVQRIEKISTTAADNTPASGIVAYSLGNFISSQRTSGKDCGIILNVTFEHDPATSTVTVKDVTYIPTYVYVNSKSEYSILPAGKYLDTPDLLDALNSSAKSRVKNVWDDITSLVGSTDNYHPIARSGQ